MNWYRVAAIGLLVAASQLLLWWLTPKSEPPQVQGPPRSGYSLDNFSLELLNSNGTIALRVQAPQLQRRNADGALFITKPQFRVPGGPTMDWFGEAGLGWINSDGDTLKLSAGVVLQNDAQTRIVTDHLTAWPGKRQAMTDALTHIRQPGRTLAGVGMRVDLTRHTLELLADVHGTFHP